MSAATLYDHNLPSIVSYGGGTNSTAVLVGMVERRMPAPLRILFADTGGERPEIYTFLGIVSDWLEEHCYPRIQVVQRVDVHGQPRTLEQDCLERNMLPSVAYGFKSCSQKYKIQPQDKFCNNDPLLTELWASGAKVIKYIGFDADEERRAIISNDRKYIYRYPLIEWDWGRDDCVDAISRAGLPQPGKSACFFCPNSKLSEIRELSYSHPQLIDRAIALERNADLKSIKGLGRRFKWSDIVAQGDLFKGFADLDRDMPCGCYDG